MAGSLSPIRVKSTHRRVHEAICNLISGSTRVILDDENTFTDPPATLPERFNRPHYNVRIDGLSKQGSRKLPFLNLRFVVTIGMRHDLRTERYYAERDVHSAKDQVITVFERDRAKSLNGRDLTLINERSPGRRNDLILHELEYEAIVFQSLIER